MGPSKKKTAKLPLPFDILLATGKNIGGGALEYIKEIFPSTSSIVEEASASINEVKGSFKNTSSQITNTAKSIFRLETFKTIGKWYMDKEDEFGFGDIDGSLDFDVGNDFDDKDFESNMSSFTETNTSEMDKASDKISETVVETSHKLMETQVASLASITNSMEKTVGIITAGFEKVNATLKEILEVVTKNSSALIELSSKMTGKVEESSRSRNDGFNFREFLNNFSFENYFKKVKQNFQNLEGMSEISGAMSMIPTMVSMMFGPMGGGKEQIKDLFKGGISLMLNSMFPTFNEAFKKLDSSINKEITRGLLSLGKMGDSSNQAIAILAKLFGVQGSLTSSSNSKQLKYTQEVIPFDSETKEYITRAIPQYLQAITAAVTGRNLIYNLNTRQLVDKGKFLNEQRERLANARFQHLDRVFTREDFKNAGVGGSNYSKKFNVYESDPFYQRYLNLILDTLMGIANSSYINFSEHPLIKNLQSAINDEKIFKIILDYFIKDEETKKELNKPENKNKKNKIIDIGKLIQSKITSKTDSTKDNMIADSYGRKLVELRSQAIDNINKTYDTIYKENPHLYEEIAKKNDIFYNDTNNTLIEYLTIKKRLDKFKNKYNNFNNKRVKEGLNKIGSKLLEKEEEFRNLLKDKKLEDIPEDFIDSIKPDKIFLNDNESKKNKYSLVSSANINVPEIKADINLNEIKEIIKNSTDRIVNVLTPVKDLSTQAIQNKKDSTTSETQSTSILSSIDNIIKDINTKLTQQHDIIFKLLDSNFNNISEYFKKGIITIDSGKVIEPSSQEANEVGKIDEIKVDEKGKRKTEKKKTKVRPNSSIPVKDPLLASAAAEGLIEGITDKQSKEDKAAKDKAVDDWLDSSEVSQEKALTRTKELIGKTGSTVKEAIKNVIENKPEEAATLISAHVGAVGKGIFDTLTPDLSLIGNNLNAMINGGSIKKRLYDNKTGKNIGYESRKATGLLPALSNYFMTSFDSLFNKKNAKAIDNASGILDAVSKNQPGAAIDSKKKVPLSKIKRNITNAFIGATGGGILGGPIGLLLGTIAGGAASFIDLDTSISKFLFGDFFDTSIKSKDRKKKNAGFIEEQIRGWVAPWQFQFKKFQEVMTVNYIKYIQPAWKSIANSFEQLQRTHFFKNIFQRIMELPIFKPVIWAIKGLGNVAKNLLKGINKGLQNLLPNLFETFITGGANLLGKAIGHGGRLIAGGISKLAGTEADNKAFFENAENEADKFIEGSETLGGRKGLFGIFGNQNKKKEFLEKANDNITNKINSLRDAILGTDNEVTETKYYNDSLTLQAASSKSLDTISTKVKELSDYVINGKNPDKTKDAESKAKEKKDEETNKITSLTAPVGPMMTDESSGKETDEAGVAVGEATVQGKPFDIIKRKVSEFFAKFKRRKKDAANESKDSTDKSSGSIFSTVSSFVSGASGLLDKVVDSPLGKIIGSLIGGGILVALIAKGIQSLDNPEAIIDSIKKLFGIESKKPKNGSGSGAGGNGTGGSSSNTAIFGNPLDAIANVFGYDNLGAAMWNPFAPIRYNGTNITAQNVSNAIHIPEKLRAQLFIQQGINNFKKGIIKKGSGLYREEIARINPDLKDITKAEIDSRLENLSPKTIKEQRINKLTEELDTINKEIDDLELKKNQIIDANKAYSKNIVNDKKKLKKKSNLKARSNFYRDLKEFNETELEIIESELKAKNEKLSNLSSKETINKNKLELKSELSAAAKNRKELEKIKKLLEKEEKFNKNVAKFTPAAEADEILEGSFKGASKAKAELGKLGFKAGVGAIGGGMAARGAAATIFGEVNPEDFMENGELNQEAYNKAVEQREDILNKAQAGGSAVGGVTTAFSKTPKWIESIMESCSKCLDNIKELIDSRWKGFSSSREGKKIFVNIRKYIKNAKWLKTLSKTAGAAGKKLSSILTKTGLNTIGAPAAWVTATVTGAASAVYSTEWMFGVKTQDVDILMRTISGVIGGIFDGTPVGIVELIDLIIDPIFHKGLRQMLAQAIYTFLEDPENTLKSKQENLRIQKDAYNEKYGTHLSDAQFNDMVNERAIGKMWSGTSKMDEKGNYVFDENGNVIKTGGFSGALGFGANISYAKDSAGNVLRNRNGKAIANIDKYGNELKDDTGFGKLVNDAGKGLSAFFLGSKHNYATDANGNAIVARNPDGSIKYDENGNPIYIDNGPTKGLLHQIAEGLDLGLKNLGNILTSIYNGVVFGWKAIEQFIFRTIPTWIRNAKTAIWRFAQNVSVKVVTAFNDLKAFLQTQFAKLVWVFNQDAGKSMEYDAAKSRSSMARLQRKLEESRNREDKEFEIADLMTDKYDSEYRGELYKSLIEQAGDKKSGLVFSFKIKGNERETKIDASQIQDNMDNFTSAEDWVLLSKYGFTKTQLMLLPKEERESILNRISLLEEGRKPGDPIENIGKDYIILMNGKEVDVSDKGIINSFVKKRFKYDTASPTGKALIRTKSSVKNITNLSPTKKRFMAGISSVKNVMNNTGGSDLNHWRYMEVDQKTMYKNINQKNKSTSANTNKSKHWAADQLNYDILKHTNTNASSSTNKSKHWAADQLNYDILKHTNSYNILKHTNPNDIKVIKSTKESQSNNNKSISKKTKESNSTSSKFWEKAKEYAKKTNLDIKETQINNTSGTYKYPCDRIPEVTAPFGEPRVNSKGQPYTHTGVDLGLSYENLLACCDGNILFIGNHGDVGYGNYIVQDSPDHKYGILYGHLKDNSIKCKEGQRVKQGEILAITGSTGHSTGPHLHLEFRGFKDGRTVIKGNFEDLACECIDPMPFIKGEKNSPVLTSNSSNSNDTSSKFSLGILSLIPGFDILNNALSNGLASLLGFSNSSNNSGVPYDGIYTPISNASIEENRKAIYAFLRSKNLSPEGASAVIGNLYAESTLNPSALNSIGAYGIAQWLDSRRTNLERKYPSNYNTLDGQLNFLYDELNNYPNLLKALRSPNGNTSTLAEQFCRVFERPSEGEIIQSMPKRQSYAKDTLNKNWGGPVPISLKDMSSLFSGVTSNKMIDIPNPIDSLINVLNNILNEIKQIKGINSTNTNIMGGMASGSIRQKEQVQNLLNRINNYSATHTPVAQQINSNIINFVKGI